MYVYVDVMVDIQFRNFFPTFVDGDKACLSKLKSEPDVLIGTVDMAHIENEREKYPYLKDRNQEMYARFPR